MSYDGYDLARDVTDEAFGEGTYAQMHKGNPNPAIQAALRRGKASAISMPDWLNDDARLALAEAMGKHRGFHMADREDLRRCERCGEHAAIGSCEGTWVCGVCAPKVSIFSAPMSPNDLRQRALDVALRQVEAEDG